MLPILVAWVSAEAPDTYYSTYLLVSGGAACACLSRFILVSAEPTNSCCLSICRTYRYLLFERVSAEAADTCTCLSQQLQVYYAELANSCCLSICRSWRYLLVKISSSVCRTYRSLAFCNSFECLQKVPILAWDMSRGEGATAILSPSLLRREILKWWVVVVF